MATNPHDGSGGVDDDDERVTERFSYSADSSFHGDPETKADCEAEVAGFNVLDYWDVHQGNFKQIIAQQQTPTQAVVVKRESHSPETQADGEIKKIKAESPESIKSEDKEFDKVLFNPYEGNPMAYQLDESLDDFLARLKPSTATTEAGGAWIRIANPHCSYRPGSEDVAGFKRDASKLLEAYLDEQRRHQGGQHYPRGTAAATAAHTPARDRLEAEILALARAKKVTTGKWMLFVPPASADSVWQVVATATLNGTLGRGAKVAVANYSDMTDVERVWLEMKNLDLPVHGRDGRGIFYKCAAYSYLDIYSGNEFGLKPSLYCSRDFEGGGQGRGRHR
ncbi:hypothetical protein DV735_g5847, partial [Chaetothyriales sp. CBS 134920]